MIDSKECRVSHDSFCLPRGDNSQAGEDVEMGVSVSSCCITNHPQTQ